MRTVTSAVLLAAFVLALGQAAAAAAPGSAETTVSSTAASPDLAGRILADKNLGRALDLAKETLRDGFNAGSAYPEVWIRDLNTFIELHVDLFGADAAREALLNFLRLQAPDGDVPDGYVPADKGHSGYFYRLSPLAPGLKAHKNTVETDQETSLVQAVRKFVDRTNSLRILEEKVGDLKVWQRLRNALEYLYRYRFCPAGLIWGATTADWGDVQPEHAWGVAIDENTHRAVDVYDNAMLAIAIRDYLELVKARPAEAKVWEPRLKALEAAVRRHLWDARRNKFIPHLYLEEGSPFPPGFDENAVYYHGGTIVAIEAGLLTREETLAACRTMAANMRAAKAASIGLTLHPPYPAGFFRNPAMAEPHSYQNGGDWTWFGARIVRPLLRLGLVEEAYAALKPMTDRAVRDGGYHEWHSLDNKPQGASGYKGAAGVVGAAVQEILAWAQKAAAEAGPPIDDARCGAGFSAGN